MAKKRDNKQKNTSTHNITQKTKKTRLHKRYKKYGVILEYNKTITSFSRNQKHERIINRMKTFEEVKCPS